MLKDLSKYEDTELVALLGQKKGIAEKAFSELYHRYYIKIYTYCVRFIGDKEAAEDIFQETFISMHKHIRDGKPLTNINGFLYKIAKNLCLNYLRDRRQTVELEDNIPNANPYDEFERDELFSLVMTALDMLGDESKDIFIMKKLQKLTLNEISEITGVSYEAVRKRINATQKKILKILEPYIKDLSKY